MSTDQPVVALFALAPVVLLLVFGMTAILLRSTLWAAICEAIAHGGFAFGSVLTFYFVIPRFKKVFEDFGVELPVMTKFLIGVSDLTVNYWYIFLFLIVAGTAIDVLAFVAFHRNKEIRYAARIFSGFVTLILLAQGATCATALLATQAKLMQDLR